MVPIARTHLQDLELSVAHLLATSVAGLGYAARASERRCASPSMR